MHTVPSEFGLNVEAVQQNLPLASNEVEKATKATAKAKQAAKLIDKFKFIAFPKFPKCPLRRTRSLDDLHSDFIRTSGVVELPTTPPLVWCANRIKFNMSLR